MFRVGFHPEQAHSLQEPSGTAQYDGPAARTDGRCCLPQFSAVLRAAVWGRGAIIDVLALLYRSVRVLVEPGAPFLFQPEESSTRGANRGRGKRKRDERNALPPPCRASHCQPASISVAKPSTTVFAVRGAEGTRQLRVDQRGALNVIRVRIGKPGRRERWRRLTGREKERGDAVLTGWARVRRRYGSASQCARESSKTGISPISCHSWRPAVAEPMIWDPSWRSRVDNPTCSCHAGPGAPVGWWRGLEIIQF